MASVDLFEGLQVEGEKPKPKATPPSEDLFATLNEPVPQQQPQIGTAELPEFDLPFEPKWRQLKTAFGLLTTFNPERQVKVLQGNYPELKFFQDDAGEVIVDGRAYGGNVGYLNKPGVSQRDALQFGGQVAMFTPAGRAGRAGAGLLSNMGRVGGASAATQAGIDLANQSTFQLPNISDIDKTDVAVAGVGGALFEPISALASRILPAWKQGRQITDAMRSEFRKVASQVGIDPATVDDTLIARYLDAAENATPESAAAKATGSEFNIRQTRGQASQEPGQLSLEDTLRNTTVSPRAQQRMRSFESMQNEDIGAAVGRTQAGLGGPAIATANDAAATAGEGIIRRGDELYGQVGPAYDAVGDAFVTREGLQAVADRMTPVIRKMDFIRDPDLAPSTAKAVKELTKHRKVLAKYGDKVRPAHIRTMEAFRRKLRALEQSAKNPNDRRQIQQMLRAYDEGLEQAFDAALISGDDAALEALKSARELRSRYGSLFQRNDVMTRGGQKVKDTAGDFVERLMAQEPTPEQISNALYGVAKLGSKQGSAALAQRFKRILGEDSAEWAAVRQGAFLKLFAPDREGVYSGRIILGRLQDALQSGQSFMREVFTPSEIAKMKRLGFAIKTVQPGKQNPSGTAYKLADIATQSLRSLLPSLGFSVGGPAGAAVGAGAAASAGWRQTLQSLKATNQPIRRVPVGGGQPLALSGRERLSNRTPEDAILQTR